MIAEQDAAALRRRLAALEAAVAQHIPQPPPPRPIARPLTVSQRTVLRAIVVLTERFGMPPTLREIGAEVGIRSTNAATDHLFSLERKGALERANQKARALRVTAFGLQQLGLLHKPPTPGAFIDVIACGAGHARLEGAPCAMCELERKDFEA